MKRRIIVANRLSDGVVVYLTTEGEWTSRIDHAEAAETQEGTDALLDVAKHAARTQIVVDPYAIETTEEDGKRLPVKLRERIRLIGPTIRPDLGRDVGVSA